MELRKKYGIDPGSGNFKFYSQHRNNLYMEKNMIAVRDSNKVVAVGDAAYEMYEKAPSDIQVDSPLSLGLISDIPKMEYTLYTLIHKNDHIPFLGGVFYYAIPMNLSHLEQRTYDTITNGGRMHNNKVFLVEKPIADAVALEIPMEKTVGSMIVNIGEQTTELSILAYGKVIISKTLPIGGAHMNQAICDEIRKTHKLLVGSRTANRLKHVMGSMMDKSPEARKVYGIDSLSGLPREEVITASLIHEALKKPVLEIGQGIKTFLERTPPQVSYQILKEGIHLTGGTTHLPELDHFLAEYLGYGIVLSDLYEFCTVTGLKKIINEKNLHKWAIPIKQRKL